MSDIPPEIRSYVDVNGLTVTAGEIVLTRDRSSGRVHKRLRLGTGLATLEGDNLDSAGDFEVITPVEFEVVEADALCRHCFGEQHQAGQTG